MRDAPPGKFRDVDKALNATQVNKNPKLSDIGHLTRDLLTWLDGVEKSWSFPGLRASSTF
jgi:hypothetical protein